MKKDTLKFLKDNNVEVDSIIELKEGISNTNYLINDSYVLKEPFDVSFSRINSAIVAFQNKNNLTDISPAVLAYNTKLGLLLTKYLKGYHPLTKEELNDEIIDKIINLLSTFHLSSFDLPKLDYISLLTLYRNMIDTKDRIYLEVIESSSILQGELEISHMDLLLSNFMINDSKHLELIDYEFCSYAPKYFDLISLLEENNLNDNLKAKIICKYFDNEKEKEAFLAKYNTYAALSDLLWYHWAYARYINSGKEVFYEIAIHKKDALYKHLKLVD